MQSYRIICVLGVTKMLTKLPVMKKISWLLAIVCFPLLITSCKKDNSVDENTDYYLSAKVGGTLKTYKALTYAIKVQMDTMYTIALNASATEGSPEQLFLIIGRANQPIATGTFTDEGEANQGLVVASGYNPGTSDDANIYAAGLQVDNNPRLTITITTLTDKTISGTFSGTYYDHGGDGTGTIAVTEGSFHLPVTQ